MTGGYPEGLTAPLPSELWVELTSKCPFDCIFCSRKLRRGAGEDMPFELYRGLIAQLEQPEVIRLNYSGESGHYPRLAEAVELASSTGAATELVTALASIPPRQLNALAAGPLDRLSVSLHTLDHAEFAELYRFGSLEALLRNLDALALAASRKLTIDLAFVAMDRNLGQLGAIAALARARGIGTVHVHPVLRRDAILVEFPSELDGGRMRPAFKQRLSAAVAEAEAANPGVKIAVANPDAAGSGCLAASPAQYPGELPGNARIWSCEQSPWRTMHVLSNGDVVPCEVHDKRVLGSLTRASLREIWNGAGYRGFRVAFHRGELAECRRCPWKTAYAPERPRYYVSAAHGASAQLTGGWHAEESQGVVWSHRRATAVLGRRPGASAVRIRGYLPPGSAGHGNRLSIGCNGRLAANVENRTTDIMEFDRAFPVFDSGRDIWDLAFETTAAFRGSENGWNQDRRPLGFALVWMQAQESRPRLGRLLRGAALAPLAAGVIGLDAAMAAARRLRPPVSPRLVAPARGVSVVIPERANAELLGRCLRSVWRELERVDEPSDVIVAVNGSLLAEYEGLRAEFPATHWIHSPEPLGFVSAIRPAIEQVRHGWVYLANNDIEMEPGCLEAALAERAPDVFAVASRIAPGVESLSDEETNLTGFHFANGVLEIFDRAPESAAAESSFYAGGGSSLFRADVLREFLPGSAAYRPFYWEDVEWAMRAAMRYGLRVVFAPSSRVRHVRRATVGKFHDPVEVERVFRRNGLLCQLRNVTAGGSRRAVFETLAASDWVTVREVLFGGCVLAARAGAWRMAGTDADAPEPSRFRSIPPGDL
ncbi:MAG: SPASM domain-containing protein [Bryobacteraceae bacterium]